MIINYLFEFDEKGNVSKYIGTDPENVFPIRCRKVGSDNPFDNDFMDKISAIRESVSWSLRRHWTHSWILIFGVILSIFIYMNMDNPRLNAMSRAKDKLEKIKNWEEGDTVFAEYPVEIVYFNDLSNPKHAKSDMLCRAYDKYQKRMAWAEECKHRADTASTKDAKKSYLEYMEKSEEEAEDALKLITEEKTGLSYTPEWNSIVNGIVEQSHEAFSDIH